MINALLRLEVFVGILPFAFLGFTAGFLATGLVTGWVAWRDTMLGLYGRPKAPTPVSEEME